MCLRSGSTPYTETIRWTDFEMIMIGRDSQESFVVDGEARFEESSRRSK